MQDKESDGKLVEIVARAICPSDSDHDTWGYWAASAQSVLIAIKEAGMVIVPRERLIEAMTYPFPEPTSVKSWRFTWKHLIAPRFRAMITTGEE